MTRAKGSWQQVEAVTLADQVYRLIRDRIISRTLEPGEYIREQEVSTALGVSRTPVREAFGRLASQGFLRRVPHRGFQVPDDPWEELLEVYPIVTALEVLAGSLSFERLGLTDIRRLRKLNSDMVRAGNAGNSQLTVELNNAFHKVFSDASGNNRLSQLLDQLRDQVILLDLWYFSVPENLRVSAEEHDRIIDALEKSDFERALKTIEINYSRGRVALEAEMRRGKKTHARSEPTPQLRLNPGLSLVESDEV